MTHARKHGKLLISMLGRHRAEQYVNIIKAAGARGGTITYGRSTIGGKFMQLLSLADVHQEIVFTLMGEEADAVVAAVRAAACANPKKYSGMFLLLDVDAMLIRVKSSGHTHESPEVECTMIECGYKLITAIVNNGYADDVMVAARKAGAAGGSILNARGTGTQDDVKFFGITLVPEKEMLLIVAANDKADDIINAISAVPHLSEPGGGIVFSLNVEQFMTVGN